MNTYRETVSRVANTLRALSKDNRLPRRYILKTLQDKAKFFISAKMADKSLYRETNLFKTLDCVEMIPIDMYKCDIIEFRSCKKLMRSAKKLPELIYSKYGSSILEVTSIDGEFLFKPITLAQYRLNKQRAGESKQQYFYVKDGYLFLPNSEVERVSVYLLTLDLYESAQCSDCSDEKCKSFWDFEFPLPDKIIEIVVSETLKELSMNRQLQEDQNPNLQDNG